MQLLLNLLLPLLVAGAPRSVAPRVLHERRDVNPVNWLSASKAPANLKLPVRISLTQNDIEAGHDMLMAISDPESDRYGKHYTAQEVANLFAPTDNTIDAVRSWLVEHGILEDRHSFSGYHITFDASVDELEQLLDTEYHIHDHITGAQHVACNEYSLPEHIVPHIDFITPTVGHDALELEDMRHFKRSSSAPASAGALPTIKKAYPKTVPNAADLGESTDNCDVVVTAACVRALYGIPAATMNNSGNALGIFENYDVYDQPDLSLYFASVAKNVPASTHPNLTSIDGGKAPTGSKFGGTESLLDLTIAYSLLYPQSVNLLQVDDGIEFKGGFGDTFLDALDASFCTYEGGDNPKLDPKYPDPKKGGYKGSLQCGGVKAPNVISISYGLAEFVLPYKYTQRQCYEYMKLSLQGTTFVYASGDSGVASRSGCPVIGHEANGTAISGLAAGFPASCPYVLSVGATQIPYGSTVDQPEVAAEAVVYQYWSAGGFSNRSSRPSYQNLAVDSYLSLHPNRISQKLFNANGRGFPDISANGNNWLVFSGGTPTLTGGTSQAAPIVSSILNMINENRLAAGKSVVGFVNPVLYKNPHAFHDIVSGSNPGCGTHGFAAVPGWDPVTGLGTPNYPALLKVFMALP